MKNEQLKRMVYLMGYDPSFKRDKSIINEEIDLILESKETEMQSRKILSAKGMDENEILSLIKSFKELDPTPGNKLISVIAKAYSEAGKSAMGNIKPLLDIFDDLIKRNKILSISVSPEGYMINDKKYDSFQNLKSRFEGNQKMEKGLSDYVSKMGKESDTDEIIVDGESEWNNISVYDGNDVGRCIHYTLGGLTEKSYNFCIGQLANTNWQDYRDKHNSTFYYVIDKNRTMEDPLHIVVVDIRSDGIYLTDENNNTGNIAEYGNNSGKYMDYLRGKGVPVDKIFINKSKTPEEDTEQKKLGISNSNIDWFKDLSYEEKSKYIGRGHLLSDEQFEYLWDLRNENWGYKLLNKYLNTGNPLPEHQFNILMKD